MARKRFHGLKKVKIRASWNKYNLYNISRFKPPNTSFQTYYQQKWSAKSLARAYHGEQIREKQWQRMFTPKFNSVVPMDHRYLAETDGSEMAAGRGSGLEKDIPQAEVALARSIRKNNLIPYMHMTFAPIERRLDMAIFRALFASSARQARQFVVHGKVKVNGKKMIYPGYLLNPGDMYQVDVESVLFATGALKTTEQRRKGRVILRGKRNRNVSLARFKAAGLEQRAAKALAKAEKDGLGGLAKPKKSVMQDSLEERKTARAEIQSIIDRAESYLRKTKKWYKLGAVKRKQIRALKRRAKNFMGRVYRIPIKQFNEERLELVSEWEKIYQTSESTLTRLENAKAAREKEGGEDSAKSGLKIIKEFDRTQEEVDQQFRNALARARMNPIDSSKPYATPWKPRPFMSAFAFIPRYLEVNHKICSAVYLRHPVARPGLAEVPTPFPMETLQLAFNWYLRRR